MSKVVLVAGLAAVLLGAGAPAARAATWSYGFDTNSSSFSGTDGWVSQYCTDPWTTALNGGVCPKTDDGCGADPCTQSSNCGYNWGYYLQWGQCVQSDPLDNHITYGPKTWADYVFRAEMRNDDDDTFGFVFRYMNSGQFYLFLVTRSIAPMAGLGCSQTAPGAALYRIEGSQGAVLGTAAGVMYQPGFVHKVRITVQGAHITVEFDTNHDGVFTAGEKVFDLDDPDPLPSGQVGFFAWENGASGQGYDACSAGNCWFDNAEVDVLAIDDPCDGISWEGVCVGNTSKYCSNGNLVEENCNDCCTWIPEAGYYDCAGGQLCDQDCVNECQSGGAGCSEQGTHAWTCVQDSTGCWVRSWTACSQTGVCDPGTGECTGSTCQPQCGTGNTAKQCGDDGCGGSCGTCPAGTYCGPAFTCVSTCVPACQNKQCGPDGCGGSCGTCPPSFQCSAQGQCVGACLPNCVGKQCGDDGCGGSCGVCPPGLSCSATTFTCVQCAPDCAGKQCGSDGCIGLCGTCPEGFTCEGFQCVQGPCEPQCVSNGGQAKECGPDGCDGFCGFCAEGEQCSDAGLCVATCLPDCTYKECGSDGCGGLCGLCPEATPCVQGLCQGGDPGSCVGLCGGQAEDCWCDAACADYGDCCPDVCDACPELPQCEACDPTCPEGAECGDDGCGGTCGACPEGFACDGWVCIEDGPVVPETCREIQLCIEACGGNAACESACFEAAPAPAQEAFFTLVQCAQGLAEACPGCPEGSDCWYPCLLEHCGVEADACWEPAGDCGDILGCAQECGGVQGCMGDCLTTLGAAADKLHFLDLVGCVEDACAGQPQGCVQEALEGVCAPVLELCLGGGCTPDCEGMECGDDGCGGQCGACDESQVCVGGLCMDDDDPCVAACKDRECGAVNGCLCGTCPEGEACDGGLCIPGGTCEPGAYKQCVGNVLYWFDSCGVQGPPNEVCEIACVDDHCETGDPGTGDVVPSDAGSDTGGGPTVFPGGEKGGGCAASPASAAPAAWMSLLVLLSLGVLRRRRASRI